MSGIDWRWLLYGTLIAIVPFSSLFLLFLWIVKQTPRNWWRGAWSGQQGDSDGD
jgi:hypothetical protein